MRVFLALLFVTGSVTGACAASDDDDVASAEDLARPPPRMPEKHRATPPPTTCPAERGTYAPPAGRVAGCTSDDECTAGSNGRCAPAGLDYRQCTYDTCAASADCGADAYCACREDGQSNAANRCVPAGGCTSDADCGGPYCSPSLEPGGCGGSSLTFQGYFCHSAADECIDDADCTGPSTSGGRTCDYDAAQKKWRCSVRTCVSD